LNQFRSCPSHLWLATALLAPRAKRTWHVYVCCLESRQRPP
jgi:hypothetical protein